MKLLQLLPLALLMAYARSQTTAPVATHVLVTGKLAHSDAWSLTAVAVAPQPVIAMGADRSTLFALIPQEDRRWQLQMLTGWETASPRVESLSFDGDDSLDKHDFMSANMTPTPDGKTMLVRIFVFNLRTYQRSAVVLMVDLRDFHVVWRRVSSDPLVANSRWLFSRTGALVAAEGPPPSMYPIRYYIRLDVFDMDPTSIGDHEAALLSLPEFTHADTCEYMAVSGILSKRDVQLKSDGCKELLEKAGVSSILDLSLPTDGRTPLPYATTLGCRLDGVSVDSRHKLFSCYGGTDNDGQLRIKSRVEQVASDAGTVILDVPVGVNEEITTTLATLNGRDYLLLLRKGLKLEVYAVP